MVVTHGNGPQVGSIKLQNQLACEKIPEMNLFVCGAQSQGYLGFLLAQTLQNVFAEQNIHKNVCSVVTQTCVDPKDPAFQHPSKPIGRFYTAEEAEVLKKEGKNVIEDSGRGWRVVVPSPMPKDIVEGPCIHQLVDGGNVVISTGGGGIPVIRDENNKLHGIEAVIDKDLGASVLAALTNADLLMILTDVECAYADFRGPNKRPLIHLTLKEAMDLNEKGEFAQGSMGPKVSAAIRFVQATGKEAIITALNKVEEALAGKTGTHITM
jgi:carbamate kinase